MRRDFSLWEDRASGLENKKTDLGIRSVLSSGAFLVRNSGELRTSGVSPDPPWPLPARLAESTC